MKIRCFEENDIKPIYELLKNELGYEVDYSLFVLRVQEMIKNNYLIYVACIENKVVGFIGIEVSYVFELPKQIMRVNALAIDKNYQNKGIGKQLIQKVEKYTKTNNMAAITLNSGISRKTAHIFYEKQGVLYPWEKGQLSEERLRDMIQQMVGAADRIVNEAQPIVDTRLPDGSRVNIVLQPVSLDGSCISIRKFCGIPMNLAYLVQSEAISEEAAELLKLLVKAGYNIFISGGTGSGKTTFLNALSEYIPEGERVITIEDSAELQLNNIKNLVRLETRPANGQGAQEISIRDLIRTALRMRPDRIIVGEVRGAEALDMLQAMNTGHDGSLSTGHANSSRDMLLRLETMVLMGSMQLPIAAIRRQIASAIDILVHLGRVRDGTRKVLEISEILGMDQEEIAMKPLFVFSETEGKGADVHGIWKKEGDLQFRKKLEEKGLVSESIETKDGQAVQDGTMETEDERKK